MAVLKEKQRVTSGTKASLVTRRRRYVCIDLCLAAGAFRCDVHGHNPSLRMLVLVLEPSRKAGVTERANITEPLFTTDGDEHKMPCNVEAQGI